MDEATSAGIDAATTAHQADVDAAREMMRAHHYQVTLSDQELSGLVAFMRGRFVLHFGPSTRLPQRSRGGWQGNT